MSTNNIKKSTINELSHGAIVSVTRVEVEAREHSDEVNQIITKVPSWLIRSGISIFLVILIIAISISAIVPYPEMVTLPVKIDSNGDSFAVIVNEPGEVVNVLVKKHQTVKQEQPLLRIKRHTGEEYLLRSPREGGISFSSVLQPGTFVKANQEVFQIRSAQEIFFGVVSIPHMYIDKVKEGQRVLISLDNYDKDRHGSIEGEIDFIVDEPTSEGLFNAKVRFTEKGFSDKNVVLNTWMKGNAEICVEDLTLFDRMFKGFTKKIKE